MLENMQDSRHLVCFIQVEIFRDLIGIIYYGKHSINVSCYFKTVIYQEHKYFCITNDQFCTCLFNKNL